MKKLADKPERRHIHVLPLLLGPKNAEAAVGFPWRWISEHATSLGVAFVGSGRKRAVRADAFIAALERSGIEPSNDAPPAELAPVDAAENVRRCWAYGGEHEFNPT